MLSTAQYGQIRVFESWLLILVPIASLSLYRSVDRAKYDVKENYNKYVSSVLFLSIISASTIFILCIPFKKQLQAFLRMNDFMLIIAVLYVFAYTGTIFFQRGEKQMLRYKSSLLYTILTIVPSIGLSIFLIIYGKSIGQGNSLVNYRIAGYYIPQVIGGAIIIAIMLLQGRKLINYNYWKYSLKYSLPLIPENLSLQIMNQSDKIMVQFLVDDDVTGIFALGTTISFIIWVVEDSVWNAFLPWMYEKMTRFEEKDIDKPWTFTMHGFGILSWLIIAFAPEIISFLGSSDYHDAIFLVAPMLL